MHSVPQSDGVFPIKQLKHLQEGEYFSHELISVALHDEIKEPVNRNLILKNVWKYSEESETHTVETHIHRLRKKILEKFNDENFIKNNNNGYYI